MNGTIEWICPSNIALVKYWGKRPVQLPLNPSISFTLSEAVTRMKIEYDYNKNKPFSMEFIFNGNPRPEFEQKLTGYLGRIRDFIPELEHTQFKINSANTFPHSAGIASSASSFGGLALALACMKDEMRNETGNSENFVRNASLLARLGSGSACRSLYGGYVLWGSYEGIPGSSDEFAIPLPEINNEFLSLRDSILVVSSEPKQLSSSKGHQLMEQNVFTAGRRSQALNNLQRMLDSLREGDWTGFMTVMEDEALSLHAMLMTSSPGYILLKPGTLEIIEKIRNFRKREGIQAGFTLDAGPNVHMIYPQSAEAAISNLINNELSIHCEHIIHDKIGIGPERIR